jgi:hypothetical protein
MEEEDVLSLPSELSATPYINYQPNSDATLILAQALLPVESAHQLTTPPPLRPELTFPLTLLRDEVMMLPKSTSVQLKIFYTLREFLERYDTFGDAKDILLQLYAHPYVSRRVALEIEKTFRDVRKLRSRRKTSRRVRQVMRDIALLIIVLLILLRGFQFFPTLFRSGDSSAVMSPSTETSLSQVSDMKVMDRVIQADVVPSPMPTQETEVESAEASSPTGNTHSTTSNTGTEIDR